MAAARPGAVLLLIIYLGFISLGLPDGTLGIAWPRMHETLGLPLGLGGTLLLVITLLSAASGFASGRLIARFHTGPVVLASCVLTSGALLAFAHARGFGWLLAAAVPLGFGAGAVDAGLNGYVARHYSGRHMNWLHACWGIGATAGPLVFAQALARGSDWRSGYLILGIAQGALALVFLLTLRLWGRVPEQAAAAASGTSASARTPTMPARSPAGWLSAGIFALYVAAELTAGLWAASILILDRGVAPATAGLCSAAYYGAITAGRIAVGAVGDRWPSRVMVTAGVWLASAGALIFAVVDTLLPGAFGLLLLGLGLAPIYPGLMHEVSRRFEPGSVQTVIGWQSGAAYVGAAVFPALTGWMAQHALGGVPWVVLGGTIVLALAIRQLDRMT